MHQLKISYSGIRGIVGENLTEEVASIFGAAFIEFLHRRYSNPLVIVGNDTRPSGVRLKRAFLAGLKSKECKVIEAGVVPTPTLQLSMFCFKARGAVMITASHNPMQWNGFKFFTGPDNMILDGPQMDELIKYYNKIHPRRFPEVRPGNFENRHSEALNFHIKRVLENVDVPLIRSARFRVALDSGKGAGEAITLRLLEELGCEIIDVKVKRDSEPIPANLKELCRVVKDGGCHIGFAQDLDADRLAIVSEKGEPVGEEYSLALSIRHLLEKTKDTNPVVVKNSSTSHIIDDIVKEWKAELMVVRVGEVNLSKAMKLMTKKSRIVFGGEGNGGVIYPPVGYGRDSLAGVALVLEYMAERKKKVSALVSEFPKYYMAKEKIECEERCRIEKFMEKIKEKLKDEDITEFDGIKVDFRDGSWIHVRSSNTEPVIRIIAESTDEEEAKDLVDFAKKLYEAL